LLDNAGCVPAPRVLVVDDEENISFLVTSALRLAQMEVEAVSNGRDALTKTEQFKPDLLILDIMLPDIDGFAVLQQLRNRGHLMPVLFLTARDQTSDRVRGLTSGGDDYITKPFALEELVARVQLALRRRGVAQPQAASLQAGDLLLDDDAHQVTRAGEIIHLTPTEYKLCRLLLSNVGRVVSRGQILDHVWEYDFDGESAIVETFISSLRKKVDHVEPRLIETVRGIGYTIRDPG
jgi:two-component system OmpR family response regulator